MKQVLIISTIFLTSMLPVFASDSEAKTPDKYNVNVVLFPIQKSTISALSEADLMKYPLKEGDVFKENDTIVKMDDRLYKEYYNAAKTDLDKAQSSFDYASKIYEQDMDMYKKNGLSLQELEKSKLDLALAKSGLEQSEAALKIAEIKLNFCTIKAPFDGRVTQKIKNEFEYVRVGEPVIEVIDDHELLAVMNLPSSNFDKVLKWKKKVFYIDELKKTFNGNIYEISGDINPESRTFQVKFSIDNPNHELMSGMSGHLVE